MIVQIVQIEMLPESRGGNVQPGEDALPIVAIDVALHGERALRRGEADLAQIGVDVLNLLRSDPPDGVCR